MQDVTLRTLEGDCGCHKAQLGNYSVQAANKGMAYEVGGLNLGNLLGGKKSRLKPAQRLMRDFAMAHVASQNPAAAAALYMQQKKKDDKRAKKIKRTQNLVKGASVVATGGVLAASGLGAAALSSVGSVAGSLASSAGGLLSSVPGALGGILSNVSSIPGVGGVVGNVVSGLLGGKSPGAAASDSMGD